jgi:hypothetical protein
MARSISRVAFLCGLFALVAAAAGGCQRGPTWKLAPVEGTVTKGGRPLAHIQVIFVADLDAGTQGPQARGITDKTGHYRLRTNNGDNGAVVGKHRVVILDLEARMKGLFLRTSRRPQPKATARLSPENAKSLEVQLKLGAEVPQVPPRYGRFNETPLRVEVHPGPQTLSFDIP